MQRSLELRIGPAAGPSRIGAPGGATLRRVTDRAGRRSITITYWSSWQPNALPSYGSDRPPVHPVSNLHQVTDRAGLRSIPYWSSRRCNAPSSYGSGRSPVHPVLELPAMQRSLELRIGPAAGPSRSRIGAPGSPLLCQVTDRAGHRSIPYLSSWWFTPPPSYRSGKVHHLFREVSCCDRHSCRTLSSIPVQEC